MATAVLTVGEWKAASTIARRGEVTSFELGPDDGLGVGYLVGNGFQGGLPHKPVTDCGVVQWWYGVWCQCAVSPVRMPNKLDHFRPNYWISDGAAAVIGQFAAPLS